MNTNAHSVYPLVLVSCGKRKLDSAAPAKELYTSPRFQQARRFAERFGATWFVLSAKHGVVSPETVLEPYDFNLDMLRPDEKRAWAEGVVAAVASRFPSFAQVVILATDAYTEPLREAFLGASVRLVTPLSGLPEGSVTHLLARINSNPARFADYAEFYALLGRLQQLPRQMVPFDNLAAKQVSEAGVYYFFDDSECTRFTTTFANRVVRIGTHGVSKGSKSKLWQRLRTHRGNDDGSGSHRSSIFRLHVGRALLSRSGKESATWGLGESAHSDIRSSEAVIEREVSAYLSALRVMHLPVLDWPSADSDRSYIEMNSIALLTGGGPLDPPSKSWLGNHSPTQNIRESGMWNINYVGEQYDQAFLGIFRELIARYESGRTSSESLAPLNWRATMQRGGIGQTPLF